MTHNNNNKRTEKYIAQAILILKQEGLRLSLEEMATKMGITKKTLYNHFSSKDELLTACIQSISKDFQEVLSSLDDKNHAAISNLQRCFSQLDRLFVMLSPIFFSDLMRNNPNQAILEHIMGSQYFKQKIQSNLQQGIEEGVYRSDLDLPFVCEYISYSIFGFYINAAINHKPVITDNYFAEILTYHLRALTTEKGKQSINLNYDSYK